MMNYYLTSSCDECNIVTMNSDIERRKIDGEWVKALRKRLGLTQTEFAERLGVSLPSITRWELNQFRPTKLAANALLHLAATSSEVKPRKRPKK
jgi:DNA-binding transcriptional regulator YiaG